MKTSSKKEVKTEPLSLPDSILQFDSIREVPVTTHRMTDDDFETKNNISSQKSEMTNSQKGEEDEYKRIVTNVTDNLTSISIDTILVPELENDNDDNNEGNSGNYKEDGHPIDQDPTQENCEVTLPRTRSQSDRVLLRRSSRRLRSSYILKCNDFVVGDFKLRKKNTKTVVFPKLPSGLINEMVKEFTLPDEEYGQLKLLVATSEKSLTNGSCNDNFGVSSEKDTNNALSCKCISGDNQVTNLNDHVSSSAALSETIDFKLANECSQHSGCSIINECSSVECSQSEISNHPVLLMRTSSCDPIELIYRAETTNLKTDTNQHHVMVVTCQKSKIVVWKEISNNNWAILHEYFWALQTVCEKSFYINNLRYKCIIDHTMDLFFTAILRVTTGDFMDFQRQKES